MSTNPMTKQEVVHYGPIWDGPGLRAPRRSFALCDPTGNATMTNDIRAVNCRECQKMLASPKEIT